MPATPKKGRRLGGDSAHQRLMMANLAASLIAAEGIVTTESKAKALRPVAEKLITKAKKGGGDRHRQVLAYLGDPEMAHKLMADVGPRLRGDAFTWSVEFARPVLLPSKVAVRIGAEPADVPGDERVSMTLWDPKRGKPHLLGSVAPAEVR